MPEPSVIAVTDCGSTTTKAFLFERDDAGWRLAARADAATTVEAPAEDVLVGVRNVLGSLGEAAGRALLDKQGRLLRPAQDRRGIDLYLSTSSAGGGLHVAIAGVVPSLSVRSAERAALAAGAVITGRLALSEARSEDEAIRRLRAMEPDLLVLAGGVDEGAEEPVLELAEWIARSGLRPRYGERPLPLLFSGNRRAGSAARSRLDRAYEVFTSDNVLPVLDGERTDAARDRIQELFLEHVMSNAPGLQGLLGWVDAPVLPTPLAVSELLGRVSQRRDVPLLAVDIGGATTDLFSCRDGRVSRSVSANLGMSYSAANVLAEAGLDNVGRWLADPMDPNELRDRIMNKNARPTTIPAELSDLALEQALAREALRLSYRRHLELTASEPAAMGGPGLALARPDAPEKGTGPTGLIIGSGGVLSHAPEPGQTALMLLDAFEPLLHASLAKDRLFMMPHLGVLGRLLPEVSVALFEKECLTAIGDAFAPLGRVREGRVCLHYALERQDAPTAEGSVRWGELLRLPLDAADKALLVLRPESGVDAGHGPGRPARLKVTGGLVGLLLDCRGRPLPLGRIGSPGGRT